MPYIQGVASKLITVVETLAYLRDAEKLLSEDERSRVVDQLASDPECGEIIKGGGGIRNVRIRLSGRGKRGGARVIYFFHDRDFPVFALALFAKNERDDLSDAERNTMAKFVKRLAKTYGAKE